MKKAPILTLAMWVSVAAGIVFRVWYILYQHHAADFAFADMSFYMTAAADICKNAPQSIIHTIHSPGAPLLFSRVYCLREAWSDVEVFLLVLSILVLPLVWLLAWQLGSKRLAALSVIFASFYTPFTDYAAFFVSEIPTLVLLLSGTIGFLLALRLTAASFAAADEVSILGCCIAFAAGLLFGAAAVIKIQALVTAIILAAYVLISQRREVHLRLVVILLLLGCSAPIAIAANRCTTLSGGKFCLVGNDSGQNFLLGLTPDLRAVHFQYEGLEWRFQNPSAMWRDNQTHLEFDFPPWENERLYKIIAETIRERPFAVLGLCFVHIYDLLGGAALWPTSDIEFTWYTRLGNILFALFVLAPLLIWAVRFRDRSLGLTVPAFLVLPLAGICLVIFCTLGESRYRIPFDGYSLILGAAAWLAITRRPESEPA